MREILFRGKICRDCKGVTTQKKYKEGDWAFGDLSHTNYNPPLIDQSNDDPVPVDPDTVGQYTGLKDKNGKRIFEGDIVRDMDGTTYPVVWGGTGFYLRYDPPHAHGMEYELLPLCNYWHAHGPIIEIIGNIHDNPDLLEVNHEN